MNHRQIAAEALAALMHEPRTAAQLVEYTGAHRYTIEQLLITWHETGIIRRADSVKKIDRACGTKDPGKRAVLWALQTKPFALPDHVSRHGTPL